MSWTAMEPSPTADEDIVDCLTDDGDIMQRLQFPSNVQTSTFCVFLLIETDDLVLNPFWRALGSLRGRLRKTLKGPVSRNRSNRSTCRRTVVRARSNLRAVSDLLPWISACRATVKRLCATSTSHRFFGFFISRHLPQQHKRHLGSILGEDF